MEHDELPAALRSRLRRVYEWGRLTAALRVLLWVLPLVAATHRACGQSWANVISGSLLAVVTVGFLWYGRHLGAAVQPGLVAGFVPLILPLLFHGGGHESLREFCWSTTVPLSILGGVAAGMLVGIRASRLSQHRLAFVAAGISVAALAGSLGCAIGGLASLVGLTTGVVGGAVPIIAYVRARELGVFRR